MNKLILFSFFLLTGQFSYSQDLKIKAKTTYSYAYITVIGKTFSKKLTVQVDFGDTPEQIILGKDYSEILNNKKSYSAILNYMSERQYELVESRENTFSYQGTGGTSGIIFILKRPIKSELQE